MIEPDPLYLESCGLAPGHAFLLLGLLDHILTQRQPLGHGLDLGLEPLHLMHRQQALEHPLVIITHKWVRFCPTFLSRDWVLASLSLVSLS